MDRQSLQQNTPYFPIFKSLHRGGLSLWLNRRALLPLVGLPFGVALVTLILMRTYAPKDISPFMQAMLQIPADFAIGLFCAIVIAIIMNAPKKDENSGPVTFSLNLSEKKKLLIGGAIAHTLFGYLYMGGFTLVDMVSKPLRAAAENENIIRWDLTFLLAVCMAAGLYAIRFALLPILVVAHIDIRMFYNKFRAFGLSLPVFFVKIIAMMTIGFILLLPMSFSNTADGASVDTVTRLVLDISGAMAAVIAHAWAYAALSVGVRTMMENK